MDYLYKTKTTNTFEEYKRFSMRLLFKKQSLIIYTLAAAICIFGGVVLEKPIFIIAAIVYPLLVWFLCYQQVKKTFNTNKPLQNTVAEFEFYDTYFTETNPYGTTTLEYAKLHKIVETKTNFYLLIAKNQGYILTKSTFPMGLDEFLRNIKLWCGGARLWKNT